MKNEGKIIANSANRQLTAYGMKLKDRLIRKAAERNNTSRYDPKMKEIKAHLSVLFEAIVFDHRIAERDIIDFVNGIKVNKIEQLQLPSIQI